MIVRDPGIDGDTDLVRGALADQRATSKLAVARLYALVNGRVQADVVRHVNFLMCKSLVPTGFLSQPFTAPRVRPEMSNRPKKQ
jgi:hypothetical protein